MFSKAAIIALIPALAAAQICADNKTFLFKLEFNNDKEQDCKWLSKGNNSKDRIKKYCAYGSVNWACQDTCESCAETCADSSSFKFIRDNGKEKDCAWLKKSSEPDVDAKRVGDYCERAPPAVGLQVGAACPESCGFCPVVTPTTSAPNGAPTTSAPNGAPTKSPTKEQGDTSEDFTLLNNQKVKNCAWAATNPNVRCKRAPTRQKCPVTCGLSILETVSRNFLGDCAASLPPTCSDEENKALEWFLDADNHDQLVDNSLDEKIWWTERLILALIYHKTNGEGWYVNQYYINWLRKSDHCDWYRVNCNDGSYYPDPTVTGYVTSVNLGNQNLIGTIPKEVTSLSSLELLDFSYNQLTGTIPSEIANFAPTLERLSLFHNQLSGTIPPELGSLTSLIEVSLYVNQLTGTIPPEIGNLVNVRRVSLYDNQLTGTIPPEFGALDLYALKVYWNQLVGPVPLEVCGRVLLRFVTDCTVCDPATNPMCCTGCME